MFLKLYNNNNNNNNKIQEIALKCHFIETKIKFFRLCKTNKKIFRLEIYFFSVIYRFKIEININDKIA